MRIEARCKCGLTNHTFEDWVAHWKYGIVKDGSFLNRHPKLRALRYFFTTEIRLVK